MRIIRAVPIVLVGLAACLTNAVPTGSWEPVALCANSVRHLWRSMIDVDLVGFLDSPNQKTTDPRSIDCGV